LDTRDRFRLDHFKGWVDDRVGSADLVVIDAPPHAETEARIAVRVARLVVVRVQPSPLDLWATAETLKMAQDERRRSLVVLNRVPPRSRLTEDIAADLASAGTPIAATRIGNRVALAQAMALGFGVIENARMTPAAAEISALAEESAARSRVKPAAEAITRSVELQSDTEISHAEPEVRIHLPPAKSQERTCLVVHICTTASYRLPQRGIRITALR
jgi:MinD-like ATPase involved in chromosome partitioning or flagellar assembly